jgi:radical SAM superfamily enzyme YgiQ (UPF0313 family)
MKKVLLILNDNPIDPLGAMYLIGNTDAYFDVLFVSDYDENKLRTIDINQFDIVGFSTITGSHKLHNQIAHFYKNLNSKIITIMGGPHPTFFPKESLELSDIDYICMGEGVGSFNKFVNGKFTNNIISSYNEYSGKLDEPFDVDQLKIDRKLIYSKNGRVKNTIRNFMGIFGCPFRCSYCYAASYAKYYPKLKYRDPVDFVNEIKDCQNKYPTNFLYIQDDTFIINKTWLYQVTDLIKKEINLPYHCHIRCDITNEDIIRQLKNTGCYSVTFAIEDANENYRRNFLNRKMKNEQIYYTAKLLHKYDIKFRIENMVGLPLNQLKDNLNTMKINSKCHPTIGWASLFQPFPNTVLGEFCREKKLWNGNIDTINSSFFDSSSIEISNKKEVERLQKIFSLSVDNWFIRILTPLLIKFPIDNFYKYFYKKFKNKKYDKLYNIKD